MMGGRPHRLQRNDKNWHSSDKKSPWPETGQVTEIMRPDVLVIGGGPAGLSAASWCSELGLDALLVERSNDIGGQLHRIYGPIENYLGRRAASGQEMLSHFRSSVEGAKFKLLTSVGVDSIKANSNEALLTTGDTILYRALIIATGVRRRNLNVPGELEFRGKGVIESGTRDATFATDKDVVVVGGGDAAVENALILSKVAKLVRIIHRRRDLSARAEFLADLQKQGNIEIIWDSAVRGIDGDGSVERVAVENLFSGEVRHIDTQAVLVRIGVQPNGEQFAKWAELDDGGYVKVGANGQASYTNIFAVGDVANPVSPTISTAVGTGATAAKAVYELLRKTTEPSP